MKNENDDVDEKPALVKEMGLLEGAKIVKTPDIRLLFGRQKESDDE